MKSWKKWLGTVAGIVFSGYFLFFAFKTFRTHNLDVLLRTDFLLAIFCAALVNVLLVPLAGTAWSILLRSMDSHWQPTKLSAMIGFTQIAKYIPGNIAQHIGRTTVALVNGMSASLFISSVLAESILLLSASVFMGVLSISFSPASIPVLDFPLTNLFTVSTFILGASALCLPILIKYLPNLVRRFSHTKKTSSLAIPVPTANAAAKAFVLYCLSYLVLGVSLWIIASRHGGLVNVNLFLLTACFTLAWLAGYLAPGAPAGLGVREGTLALLLNDTGPAEHVLTVIIAARFATILADAICFAASSYWMKSEKKENTLGIKEEMHENSRNKLLVGGLHMGGDGYPNAKQTLAILTNRLHVQTIECGAWLPESMHLWRLRKASLPRKAVAFCRLLLGNLLSVLRVLRKQGQDRIPTYIPYPALFFLWWSSWLPVRWRPRCIADAYISVWDSMYRDRSEGLTASIAARALKAFESRALRAAQLVLVDTVANKQMFAHEFDLEDRSLTALPLAIQEDLFFKETSSTRLENKTLTVLFVGTLIPLHGIKTILEAMRLLMPDRRFRFYLLGDGQEGHLIEKFSTEVSMERFTWIREWVDLHRIADEIREADICLGVFGGAGKAQRVLPFKIYMYLASGKAIVTQPFFSLPEATPPPPLLTARTTSAQDIADAITRLADDEPLRNALASDSKAYYIQYLGHEKIASDWRKLLTRFNTSQ